MKNMSKTSLELKQESEDYVNAQLKEKGIPHKLGDFWDDKNASAQNAPVLLELFKTETSLYPGVRSLIAHGMFHGKLNASQQREAVRLFLEFVKQNPGAGVLDIVILNGFDKNVQPDDAHAIGEMVLDKRYGHLCGCLTEPLRHLGTPEAISYLTKAAREPFTASPALSALAKLRVEGTLALCEEALGRKEIQHKDAIRETYSKLKRQLAKKQGAPKHITTDEIPKKLTEWSANLDALQLPKVLRYVQKLCEFGFAKDEISEIRAVADGLSPEQTVRFKFEVGSAGRKTALWLEMFCDDEDTHDLYIFGDSDLMGQIEKALDKVIQ